MSTPNLSSILVSLDCILDTRLGTIVKIDSGLASNVLATNTYHTREEDVFEGVDRETYKQLYASRDNDTLSNSIITNIIPLLRHLVSVLKEQAIVRPFHDGAQIVLNTYPYKLSFDDQNEICKAIAVWMQGIAPVTAIHKSPAELTPLHCKSAYSLMIMYDYEEWLEANAQLFLKTQMPEVTLFVPAIYFVNKPTDEELEKLKVEGITPMKALETLAAGIISLETIDVAYFSILNDKFKDIVL